jgi:hypothetical protein
MALPLLVVKRGPTKEIDKSISDWDWRAHLQRTWLAHLEAAQTAVLEKSILQGVSCPRSCCSGRTFVVEMRNKK